MSDDDVYTPVHRAILESSASLAEVMADKSTEWEGHADELLQRWRALIDTTDPESLLDDCELLLVAFGWAAYAAGARAGWHGEQTKKEAVAELLRVEAEVAQPAARHLQLVRVG